MLHFSSGQLSFGSRCSWRLYPTLFG